MEEIWKEYKTYAGCRNRYDGSYHQYLCTDLEISNLGHVRGRLYARKSFTGLKKIPKGVYKGRYCIGRYPLYRLVYELFVGPIPKGYVIHHIDGKKDNDSLDNLQLMLKSEHAKIHSQENKEEKNKKRAEKLVGRKFTEQHNSKISSFRKKGKWFNSGIKNTFSMECPEGFKPGRLKQK